MTALDELLDMPRSTRQRPSIAEQAADVLARAAGFIDDGHRAPFVAAERYQLDPENATELASQAINQVLASAEFAPALWGRRMTSYDVEVLDAARQQLEHRTKAGAP